MLLVRRTGYCIHKGAIIPPSHLTDRARITKKVYLDSVQGEVRAKEWRDRDLPYDHSGQLECQPHPRGIREGDLHGTLYNPCSHSLSTK